MKGKKEILNIINKNNKKETSYIHVGSLTKEQFDNLVKAGYTVKEKLLRNPIGTLWYYDITWE